MGEEGGVVSDEILPYCGDPVISVDRQSKMIAIFDGLKLIRDFEPYDDEKDVIRLAKMWLALRTTIEPRVIYPQITKMTMTTVQKGRR